MSGIYRHVPPIAHFWPTSAGQGEPRALVKSDAKTGQLECKWVVKSMQLRISGRNENFR